MIKQVYAISILFFFLIEMQAQERSYDPSPVVLKTSTHLKEQRKSSRSMADTVEVLFPSWNDDCSNVLTSLRIQDFWGLVSGMNEYMDQEKAQKLELTGTEGFRIIGGVGFFAWASVVGNGNLRMNFYSVDFNDDGPGELLASTADRKVEEIVFDSTVQPTLFLIPENDRPMVTDPQFFASVDFSDLYETGDSVAVLQTLEDCGDGKDSWEKIIVGPDTGWISIFDSWNSLNADFALNAIVEFDELASADDFIKSNGITLHPAYPNPAQNTLTLSFDLERSGEVDFEVLNQLGKRIYQSGTHKMQSGKNTFEISLSTMSNGSYYYIIKSKQGNIASRFAVQ